MSKETLAKPFIPVGSVEMPGGRGGLNTSATKEQAAAVADGNNTAGHLRGEFFSPRDPRNLDMRDLPSGGAVSLFIPSSPYLPDSAMVIAANENLFTAEARSPHPTEKIYDYLTDNQRAYWDAARAGILTYEKIAKEKGETDVTILAGENCLETRTTLEHRTSRSIALPHIHLLKIPHKLIKPFDEENSDKRHGHVLREQKLWERLAPAMINGVTEALDPEAKKILGDEPFKESDSMPFGYKFTMPSDISSEDFAKAMKLHHEAYTAVAKPAFDALHPKKKAKTVPQPSYRMYLSHEEENWTVRISPEAVSPGGVIEALGLDYSRNPNFDFSQLPDEENPYKESELLAVRERITQAVKRSERFGHERVGDHEYDFGMIEKRLNVLGLEQYTAYELQRGHDKLVEQINIALTRKGRPTRKDGGLPTIVSPLEAITPQDVQDVPDGTRVFTVCWGGTNQRSGIATKEGSHVLTEELNTDKVRREQKTVTLPKFAHLIGEHIVDGLDQDNLQSYKDISTVAVSLGIPHYNVKQENGIDARPFGEPSNWNFIDYDPHANPEQQISLNEHLINYLNDRGLNVDKVYFQPDPVSVANDVASQADSNAAFLPMSILAGTGTNAALHGNSLEISSSQDIVPADAIYYEMHYRGQAPFGNETKLRTGGNRIRRRVSAAMKILGENELIKRSAASGISRMLENQKHPAILSHLVTGELGRAGIKKEYNVDLTTQEYHALKLAANKALTQAGQAIGVMASAVITAAGYDGTSQVYIPVEGSVLKDGFGVEDAAERTINILHPQNRIDFHHAFDIRGAATYALVKGHGEE